MAYRADTVARVFQHVLLGVAAAAFFTLGIGPHTGWYQTLTVLSGSMAPAVPAGAVVVAVPKPAASLAEGDILVYRPPVDGAAITSHRVVDIHSQDGGVVVRTKGDGNPAPDAWALRIAGDEVWTVRNVVPSLGFVLQGLRAPAVRFFSLMLCPLLFVLLTLARIWGRGPDRRASSSAIAPVAALPPLSVPGADEGSVPATPLTATPRPAPAWYTDVVQELDARPRAPARARRRALTAAGVSVGLLVVLALPAAAAFADIEAPTTPVATAALQPPTGLTATPGCNLLPSYWIDLSWTATADSKSTDYQILSSSDGSTYALLTTVARTTTSYRHTVGGGKTHWYKLRSIRGAWSSADTAPVSATTAVVCS